MAQTPHPTPPPPPRPNPSPPPSPNPGPEHPETPKTAAQAQEPKPGEDQGMKLEREAIKAQLANKDFKLAKPGTRDYVAGQPVDDKELQETNSEAEKRLKAGEDPKARSGTTHQKFVQQYGPQSEGGKQETV